ncbi:hypothetical protein ACFY2V_12655 [Streptomyces eurythermus]|uniref:hypothetical protein n=1 Tax=Streptomyces eurythermus TaxID=42237 RepID=UPI0036CA8178
MANLTDSPFALRPISDDVPPEAAQLAEQLRGIFSSLNITMRRYAARTHRNAGAVSRYLSGTRVPPWDFVTELLAEVARTRGTPIKTDVVDLLRKNHRHALQASSKRLHEVQQLQDQLEEADLRVRQSEIHQQVLMEGLQLRERRIAQLEVKQAEITARWQEERNDLGQHLAAITQRHESATEELARLKLEVEQLRADLTLAQEATEQAEDKCRELEEKLVLAEERAQAGEEAREASALEKAQRAADEARAMADELRQELAALKGPVSPITEPSTDAGRKTYASYLKMAEEKRATRLSSLLNRSMEELVRDFIRTSVSGDARRERDLRHAVAELEILDRVKEVCWELVRKGYMPAAKAIVGKLAQARPIDEVVEFVMMIGANDVSREAGTLVDQTLWHFAWFRQAADIPPFAEALRDERWEAWALTVMDECATGRSPGDLVELLKILDAEVLHAMLDTISESRNVTDIPPLLMRMDQQGQAELIPLLLDRLRYHREDDVQGVLDAWEMAKS